MHLIQKYVKVESIHDWLLLLNLVQPMQLATQESKNENENGFSDGLSYSTS